MYFSYGASVSGKLHSFQKPTTKASTFKPHHGRRTKQSSARRLFPWLRLGRVRVGSHLFWKLRDQTRRHTPLRLGRHSRILPLRHLERKRRPPEKNFSHLDLALARWSKKMALAITQLLLKQNNSIFELLPTCPVSFIEICLSNVFILN